MRLDALLPHCTLATEVAALQIEHLCYDSRRARRAALFFAWKGRACDGHAYLADAAAHGCVAAVCEHVTAAPLPAIAVGEGSVRAHMAQAARIFYGNPSANLTMVGITGTNGKTTVAHLVAHMLAAAGRAAAPVSVARSTPGLAPKTGQASGLATGLVGTLGARIVKASSTFVQSDPPGLPGPLASTRPPTSGMLAAAPGDADAAYSAFDTHGLTTPEAIDLCAILASMRAAGAHAVAMEASSQALGQGRLAGVDFDVAVYLNLTHDHLDDHGSLEAYFAAKALLVRQHLKEGGRAVLNADDPFCVRLRKVAPSLTFGVRQAALGRRPDAVPPAKSAADQAPVDVYPTVVQMQRGGMQLQVQTPRGSIAVQSALWGSFNVENLVAAVAVGEALQLPHADIAAGLAGVAGVAGRLQQVSGPGEPWVVVDYAHTPAALRAALTAMRPLVRGRLFCVFGCGGDRDPQKRPLMGAAVHAGANWAIVTDDNPRTEDSAAIAAAIVAGMRDAGAHTAARPSPGGYCIILDRAEAIAAAISAAGIDDAVLLAGKGHEGVQVVGTQRRHFDDATVARQALRARLADTLGADGRVCGASS